MTPTAVLGRVAAQAAFPFARLDADGLPSRGRSHGSLLVAFVPCDPFSRSFPAATRRTPAGLLPQGLDS